MFKIRQSVLFIRQWRELSNYYNENAGRDVSIKFIHSVDSALLFIQKSPYSCAGYNSGKKFRYARSHQFHKWNIIGFPYSIFFHISVDNIIIVDAIYAHKMNISSRLTNKAQKPE